MVPCSFCFPLKSPWASGLGIHLILLWELGPSLWGGHTHRVTFLWLGLSEFFQCPILRAVEFPTRPGLSACFGGRLYKPRNFRYLVADARAEAGPLEALCAG